MLLVRPYEVLSDAGDDVMLLNNPLVAVGNEEQASPIRVVESKVVDGWKHNAMRFKACMRVVLWPWKRRFPTFSLALLHLS